MQKELLSSGGKKCTNTCEKEPAVPISTDEGDIECDDKN